MRLLDLDMDYFMTTVCTGIPESTTDRVEEEVLGELVWSSERVRHFLENNLGLSTESKLPGRIVKGHNESLSFWKELIEQGKLITPFEVVHVDSHADLGLGYPTPDYISRVMLYFEPERRETLLTDYDEDGKEIKIGIGDYLLFAIAYRWISKLTYCANPEGECNDYDWTTIKDLDENYCYGEKTEDTIQLLFNRTDEIPDYDDAETKQRYLANSKREPEVPFEIIHSIEAVQYAGDFDFVVMAQSPNYTPESADFIMDIFREYIEEI